MQATFKAETDSEAMRFVKSKDMAECISSIHDYLLDEVKIPEECKEFIFGIMDDYGVVLKDLTEP
jgi:hypothetical protein